MRVETTEKAWIWGAAAALLVLSIAVSWIPPLALPLGDDHQGRILGRMVLHADNILEKGWSGSHLGAAWEPYSSAPYAHHPPLLNLLHLGVAWVQGGATALGARLILVLSGIVSVMTGAALVRKLTGHWLAVAAALAGLAISGYFWLFGRSLTLVFPLIYFLLRAYARDRSETWWVAALWFTGILGALQSWSAAFIIGLVALYDLAKGRRIHALAAGVGVAIGLGLDLLWIESAAGISALRSHLEARAAAADYGLVDWILRQGGFYLRFESVPVFLLTVIALAAGLRDPRFRPIVGALFASVLVFAVFFHQNAWVHEYWNWQISWVLALGLGAATAWVADRGIPSLRRTAIMILLVAAAAVPLLRLGGDLYATQFTEPSKAGTLVERNSFPEDQEVAWYYGAISGPRWYAWYTERPVRPFQVQDEVDEDDLVLVKLSGGDGLDQVSTVDKLDPYYLVTAGELAAALDPAEESSP